MTESLMRVLVSRSRHRSRLPAPACQYQSESGPPTSPVEASIPSSLAATLRALPSFFATCWMRLITIPNQSSVAKAFLEFGEDGRKKPSPYYDRIVDVMGELTKFTLLTRDRAAYLVDRYSERKESPEALSTRVNQKAL